MTTTPQSMSDLPELPEPSINTANHASVRVIGYTADQLREYGRLCRATAEQAAKVECDTCDEDGVHATDGTGPYDCYACGKKANPTQPAATQQPVASDDGKEAFSTWFALNYPGPYTIISDPHWHAPRIFRQAQWAIKNATPVSPSRSELSAEYTRGRIDGWEACEAKAVSPSREVEALVDRLHKLADYWIGITRDQDIAHKDKPLLAMYDKALTKCATELRRKLAPVQEKAP